MRVELRRWPAARLLAAIGGALVATPAASQTPAEPPPATTVPDSIHFYGAAPGAVVPAGVVIPAGRAVAWTGAMSPPVFNERAEPGTRERFGDTKIQAAGVLRRIEGQLRSLGLSLADVVYLRAYLVPDRQSGRIDHLGWNQAYAEYFGTQSNPVRPVRSTLGVAALSDPDWLIEIETIAVYPE